MANEIQYRHSATAVTLYFTIRAAPKSMWNTSIAALQDLVSVEWTHYDLAMTEVADCYLYLGTWPVPSPVVGWYWIDVYLQAGALPSITDTKLATMSGYWDGTTFKPFASDVTTIDSSAAAATILKSLMSVSAISGAVNQEGASTTQFITNLASATNNFYVGKILEFTSGALAGQAREVTAYDGATKTITVGAAFTSAPVDESTFILLGYIAA